MDFIEMYADRCHHGKEENILFRDLARKELQPEHKKIMNELVREHIEKEDKHFFLPCMKYFSKEEQTAMLDEFWEFDKKLIHEKYKAVILDLERNKRESRAACPQRDTLITHNLLECNEQVADV